MLTTNFSKETSASLHKKYKLSSKNIKNMDKIILLSLIAIVLFGILNIYISTKGKSSPTFYLQKQFIWFIISLVSLYFMLLINYRTLFNYAPLFYWGGITLLVITKLFGADIGGGRRWLVFGPISFQTTEIIKICVIIMIAKKLEEFDNDINTFKNLLIVALYVTLPCLFIFTQPDLGMTIVVCFMVFSMLYISGLDMRIVLVGGIILISLFTICWNSGIIQDYQKKRVTSFINPSANTADAGYHLSQSLIAIGSGGLSGTRPSLENDGRTSYAGQHVPEVQTDFIFAAIAEQFGFLGGASLLSLFGVLIGHMINIAKTAKDTFGSTLSVGIISYFLLAILQNVGMTIGLTPISGITLPLVSYGGSSLLTSILCIGLVMNIGMRREKISF